MGPAAGLMHCILTIPRDLLCRVPEVKDPHVSECIDGRYLYSDRD